ncbi:low molecular weight phosphotyrosine protein phosphatase [Tritrichomonas foetus]|uniref:Low molecular weight phosphotyrosine protein phosphatase n=1 Tax=Tritrichomonas foetus TaxID=1144522 RepID=A0A1J4KYM6_9EUKA|nr:low molecular weight phosphotyrosine protein phosphatase [Tritrichomonas foetus]|eukprot:OHT16343.1 low molecular weight phosphotyrosine protein phosphatase [Tritrichomonas foetus]
MSGEVAKRFYSSVLFVCLGNVIRSPVCEGLLRHLVNNVKVDSAAVTEDDINCHPNKFSQRIAREHGYDISSHISRLVTKKDFQDFDLIVSLEEYVFELLEDMKPANSHAKVVRFAPYDIDNPWWNPYEDFVVMYKQIEKEMDVFIRNYINPANIKK